MVNKINCKDKILDLASPVVMGILNVTQDSFFDGGKYISGEEIIWQAKKMIDEGVTIIDIGAYSTRPGASDISEKQELEKLIPAIEEVRKTFPEIIISADTFRANVAKEAAEAGADIINDISGGTFDERMYSIVANMNIPYILMHIQGTPENMQNNPTYQDVTNEIFSFFSTKIKDLKKRGINNIILDPGLGFGKTIMHNYELLANLSIFKSFGLPILIGASRKSFINKIISVTPKESLNGTTVANTIALLNGANILRVHDVKQAVEAIKIVAEVKKINLN